MSAIYLFSPVCKLPIFSRNYMPEEGVIVSGKGVGLILKVSLYFTVAHSPVGAWSEI